MKELQMRLEKAKKELAKAHESNDWELIMDCSMDVYAIQREIERSDNYEN